MDTRIFEANRRALMAVGGPDPAVSLAAGIDGEIECPAGNVVGVLLGTGTRRVRMHSARDPLAEVAGLLPPGDASLIVVVGAGAGFILDALESRGDRAQVLLLEPSSASLLATLSRRSFERPLAEGRLRVLWGPDYAGWTSLGPWITAPSAAPAVVIHPVLARERPADVRAALDVVKRVQFNARANDEARRTFAGPYLRHTLANLQALEASRDVGALFGACPDIPACVLAAGPSLNRNLEAIRPVRDGLILVAVDTALRPCLAAGVEPDLVVAVDPGLPNLRHLAVPQVPERSWLVAEPSIAPGAFAGFGSRVLTFRVDVHHPWPWLERQRFRRERLLAWGSVLSTALDLAVRLGCPRIGLAGADFAYTDGQPYCRGTAYEEDWAYCVAHGEALGDVWRRMMRAPLVVERGIDGTEVETSAGLLAFRDWVAAFCDRQPAGRVVNVTGRGLLRGLDGDVADLRGPSRDVPRVIDEAVGPPSTAAVLIQAAIASLHAHDEEPWAQWSDVAGVPVRELVEVMAAPDTALAAGLGSAYQAWRTRPWRHASPEVARPAASAESTTVPGIPMQEVAIPEALRDFRTERWQRINRRRLEHLASLHLPLAGRRVLEIGPGIGDLTDFFLDRGCHVTAVDGRQQMLDVMAARYAGHPGLSLVRMNLDPPERPLGEFDVVFCYGAFYLMSDPVPLLDWAAAACNDLFLLETLVLDQDGEGPLPVPRASVASGPLGPRGARAPRRWLWERLGERFPHVYLPSTQPAHEQFPGAWERDTSGATRVVFIAARAPLPQPWLLTSLSSRQGIEPGLAPTGREE